MRRLRSAFTLIELLVVIAIIGVLVGLLLPAVQKVREAAARTRCINQCKQIVLAGHSYHDSKTYFPASISGTTAFGAERTYFHGILPFIDQANVSLDGSSSSSLTDLPYGSWNPKMIAQSGYKLPGDYTSPSGTLYSSKKYQAVLYMPPSSPWGSSSGILVWTSDFTQYVDKISPAKYEAVSENTAVVVKTFLCPSDKVTTTTASFTSPGTKTSSTLSVTNYVTNPIALQGKATLAASFGDGASNTILVAERYRTCQTTSVSWGWPTFDKTDKQGPAFDSGVEFQIAPSAAACVAGAPQTPHSNGMVVGFADGAVRTLTASANSNSSSLKVSVFQAMLTPRGGESFTE